MSSIFLIEVFRSFSRWEDVFQEGWGVRRERVEVVGLRLSEARCPAVVAGVTGRRPLHTQWAEGALQTGAAHVDTHSRATEVAGSGQLES